MTDLTLTMLTGGQLEHRADSDGHGGRGRRRRQRHVTLTHTASGGDYVNITKDLPVSITDTDTAAIVLSRISP